MISFRKAGCREWPRTFFLAALAALSVPLFAAPPAGTAPANASRPPIPPGTPAPKKAAAKLKPKPEVKAPAPPAPVAAPIPAGPPEFADAYPSETRPTPPDLLLKPEDERKADAFQAFAQGLLAEDGAETDKMLEGYRKTLELDPGYADLAVKVAYELARKNDAPGGIQILKDAIKAAPKEALPYVYLSQIYARYLKKPDLALKYAEEALALAPENIAAHLALFELHIGAGQNQKAEQVIERAAKVETRDPKFWVQLGNLYRRLYLKDDGSCSPDELKRMNAVYLKAADIGKDDTQIITEVADYFVLSKQVKEAIPFYTSVLAHSRDGGDPEFARLRDKLAHSFIATGQRDEAIALLEEVVKANALRFATYELLGELYEQRSEVERQAGEEAKADASLQKALNNYQHSLLLDASQPRNHLRLAELMLRTKQTEKAVETMQAAKVKFPDVPFISYSLAIALSQSKRHTEALSAFAEAQADAEASHEEMLNAAFYFSYGAAAEQAGLLEKAADLFKQSIELDPNNAQSYNYLGYMWTERGENLEEAGEMIKKALAMDPENGAFLDSLGWYYFKKGEPELALKELLRAAEFIRREDKKDDATVLDHIGDACAKLGRTTEALGYWQKAVALGLEDKKLSEKVAGKIEDAKQKLTKGEPAVVPPVPPVEQQ